VDLLAQGMARIAAAFYPKPGDVFAFSDFKSNEYARLQGGARPSSPSEENPDDRLAGSVPLLRPGVPCGLRPGMSCPAQGSGGQMGLSNVIPMVPFCRTPEEGDRVLEEMAARPGAG
jgi:pyruvate,water dikinase